VVKRPHTDDLFELFPDLPWSRRVPTEVLRARIQRQVEETRARAERIIRHQKTTTERVRETLSARRRG
jgi:hypothetical protein